MGKKYIINFEDNPGIAPNREKYYKCCEIPWWVAGKCTLSKLTPYTEPDLEQVKAGAYLAGLKDGQGVTIESQQNNAFNDGYKKCLKDLEQVRKEAYEEGYKDAERECIEQLVQIDKDQKADMKANEEQAYQRGLNDAWEAARKIYLPEDHGGFGYTLREKIFNTYNTGWLFKNLSASEVIEKIRAYEQEQKKKKEEKKESCQNCKFAKNPKAQEPCVRCSHSFYDFFRAKGKESES